MKQQTIKLAKELNARYDETRTDRKYWKELNQRLTNERKYNAVLDEFERDAHRIIHKRRMKKVAEEMEHRYDEIQDEIPVENTEPPTVTKESVEQATKGIVLSNYTITFSITMDQMVLDDNGEVAQVISVTSPEQSITNREFARRVGRKGHSALVIFFNTYLKKLAKSLAIVKKINLRFTKIVRQPRALPPLKEAMSTNCLIQVVLDALTNRKEYHTKLKPRLEKLNTKYFSQGVTEVAIEEICRAVNINIHVVSILQESWFHCLIGDHQRTLLICAHNNHATFLDKCKSLVDVLAQAKKGEVTYLNEYPCRLKDEFLKDPSPIKFPIVVNDKLVAYYNQNGDLFKNQDCFTGEEDFEKNKNNEDFHTVFTLISRYFRDLKQKYKIQDRYYNEDLFNFVRSADVYCPPWCTDKDYAKKGFALDQDRAYMFYEKSEFYDHYQFPRMPTHFYKVTDQTLQPTILSLSGFAQVDNVVVPGTKELKYVRATQMIQNGGVYTTMRLHWLHSLGVTFDITKVAWANDKQKIDFRIKLTDWQFDQGMTSKQLECSLMGRLIPSISKSHTLLVHCKDNNEFLHLRYQLGDRVIKVDFDLKIIYYRSEETEAVLRGAYHIHAYILDYQQIEFAAKAMSVPFSTILKTKVDCLVLKNPNNPLNDFEGWTASDKEKFSNLRWAGFHHEQFINDAQTALIDAVDFTHRKFISEVELAEMPEVATHRYIEITGAAGDGKTYTATHLNLFDACILVPTNALKVKFTIENPGIPCMTYHSQFDTNKKKDEYIAPKRAFSNYIIDECSMICKGVMNNILSHQLALNANVVLVHDPSQLAPLTPDNKDWSNPAERYFTFGAEYKKREWHQIRLTQQMRQTDPEFIGKLTRMREVQDSIGGLQKMIALIKDRRISEAECINLYRMDKEDLMIASTNEEVDRWNGKFLKLAKVNELKLKYTKNGKYHVNNERVIMQDKKLESQEYAFASTVHIVQGLTFQDRLFVSLRILQKNQNFDPHLFYTAVSRVKSIDQLYLVEYMK